MITRRQDGFVIMFGHKRHSNCLGWRVVLLSTATIEVLLSQIIFLHPAASIKLVSAFEV